MVKVTAREGARGTHVGKKGNIIHVNANAKNEKLRTLDVPEDDVAGLVDKGLIDQPEIVEVDAEDGVDETDVLAGRALAGADLNGDGGPVGTAALTNFPAGHPSRQPSRGLPGSQSAADAEAAAAELDEDDPDAPPKARRGRKAS